MSITEGFNLQILVNFISSILKRYNGEISVTLSNCMMLQNDINFDLFVLSSLLGRGHHQFETRDTVVVASEAATPTGNGTFSVQPLNSRKNSANPFLEPAKRHSVDMKGRCTYSIQRSIIS